MGLLPLHLEENDSPFVYIESPLPLGQIISIFGAMPLNKIFTGSKNF